MDATQVVLGANGGVGHAVIKALVARGRRVRAVARSPEKVGAVLGPEADRVELVAGDAGDAASLRRAAQGASHVYYAVNPPYPRWSEVALPWMENALAAAASSGAAFVFPGNVYIYGVTGRAPVPEDHPRRPVNALGEIRVRMERRLMDAHAQGEARVTIGRFPDFYGPNANNVEVVPARGKKMLWGVSREQLHEFIHIDDVGEALVRLGEAEAAYGRDWNIPGPELISGIDWALLVEETLGYRPGIQVFKGWMLSAMGLLNPLMRDFRKMYYLWEHPLRLDGRAFERTFGPLPSRPYRQGILDTARAKGITGSPASAEAT